MSRCIAGFIASFLRPLFRRLSWSFGRTFTFRRDNTATYRSWLLVSSSLLFSIRVRERVATTTEDRDTLETTRNTPKKTTKDTRKRKFLFFPTEASDAYAYE